MKNTKLILIIIGAIIAIVIAYVLFGFSVENKAIRLEEQIETSDSNIDIQLKKRLDLIGQQVQVVEDLTEHELAVTDSVTEARKSLQAGDAQAAQNAINVVVENYPQITSEGAYKTLMYDISICEQDIRNYRETYNSQVKEYRKYVRTFPHKQILNSKGYEVIDYKNLEFDDENLDKIDTNMFDKNK